MNLKPFRILSIFVILSLTISLSFASIQPKGITIQKEGNGYIINFELPEYKISDLKAEGENYLLLEIPEYGITSDIGLPQLPQISFNIMLGYNEQMPEFEIIQQNQESKIISSRIYPKQMPWEKDKSLDDRPFTINREYYTTKGSIDVPAVRISEPFIIAGTKGVTITIFPFAYNPSENLLKVTNNASFKIKLKSPVKSSDKPSGSFHYLFKNIFVNYENTDFTPTNNYLIITPPEYEARMAQFILHKTTMGYNVFMANTTITGTTNSAILNYIQQRYNNISTRPEFILLVGDVDKIPCFTGIGEGNPYTDLNYTLLEGTDPYADAFLGRFPVADSVQLGKIINKSIYMENAINGLPKKSIFMASNDNYSITEGTHNFVIDSFFTPNGYTYLKLYTHTYSATTQQLINALNANQLFAIYSGHGSETSWADGPALSQSQVNALTNSVYPFVYSFACLTGNFNYSTECFGETWIRTTNGGAVFWGSTVTSYWDEDDILEKRLFRAMFTDGLKKTSPMFCQAKIYLVQYFGSVTSTMRRYLEMYNCFGDPSIYEATYGPSIGHTPLPNTENLAGPYTVNCTITPAGSAIDPTKTRVFWTRAANFDSVLMTNTGGNNWTANIPGNNSPAVYKYYIKTSDVLNRVVTLPGGAPANYFLFIASADTVKPVITHSPLGNVPKINWPATVTANVTDNIGVDSVWVRWYKNNTGTGIKHFKLLNTSGNTFSSVFNSNQSEVAFGDSIFYRVFARDNSSMHNTDSTSLYKFKIISQITVTIGTGTAAVGWPFYTFYMDSRTDMLYKKSELNALGVTQGVISQIGFDVVSAASQVMNGFYIKMQTYADSSLSGFVSTGWTTVYNTPYTVSGTGWQMIQLTTPYYWNGTGNLLIEICFDNSSYTSNTTINSTANTSNQNKHQHSDLSTGNGCTDITTPSSSYTGRPNIRLVIDFPTNVSDNPNNIPTQFALSQNYPNPFNPVTQIRFDLPKQTMVSLKIYDLLGREIAKLVNEIRPAGSYIIDFNAEHLSSGVYFYKMEAGEYMNVKKMMLIK